jgi:predicted lipoprotein with Yx(FWY)xxD motif
MVSAAMTPYGRALVVRSAPFRGCALYELSSDTAANPVTASHYGCPGTDGCATFAWPALLTQGKPIPATGVSATLLGTVKRTTVLTGQTVRQVTYAGHPLYRFFADAAPGTTAGENLFTPGTTPPGVWYLVRPSTGAPLSVPLSFKDMTVPTTSGSRDVLTVSMDQGLASFGLGPLPVPVYTFSADTADWSNCTGACAVFWPPARTTGHPVATGTVGGALRRFTRSDGTSQVTFDSMPLYLFAQDAYLPLSTFGPTHTHLVARGTGVTAFGGTFSLVPAP